MTDLEKKKNSTEAFFSAMLVQTAEHTGLDQQFLHFGGGPNNLSKARLSLLNMDMCALWVKHLHKNHHPLGPLPHQPAFQREGSLCIPSLGCNRPPPPPHAMPVPIKPSEHSVGLT